MNMVRRWLRRGRLDLNQQDQDRGEKERADTGVTQDTPERRASKSPPCSSGKSASSEPGSPSNKGSVSCLQAVSSGTQSMTAELATTSKIPHREEAPLASRCNKADPAQCHNKRRSEHAEDRGLNGSTGGEASKQRHSKGFLRRYGQMKHLYRKTNTEDTADSEHPSSAESLDDFLGGATAASHVPTFDILSSESEEKEESGDLFKSPPLSHILESFRSQLRTSAVSPVSSDGYTLSPLLEQTRRAHVPPTTDRLNMGCVIWPRPTHQHPPELQIRQPTSQTRPVSPPRTILWGGCSLIDIEEDHCTTDRLQSSTEGASGQLDNLSVNDLMVLRDVREQVRVQECQAAEGGAAAAAQNTQSLNNSNTETVCRIKRRLLNRLSDEEEEDQCRICYGGDSSRANPLISPCLCLGSLQFTHLDCLKTWIRSRIELGLGRFIIKRCELCRGWLTLDPDILDLEDYYTEQLQQTNIPDIPNLFLQGETDVIRAASSVAAALILRMRFRGFTEGGNPSPESPESPESPQSPDT